LQVEKYYQPAIKNSPPLSPPDRSYARAQVKLVIKKSAIETYHTKALSPFVNNFKSAVFNDFQNIVQNM
jgi:hypothetical protein